MSVKNDFVKPIAVLFFICLFVSAALAVVNNVTKPVIDEGSRVRAALARKHIIPQADDFERLDINVLRSQSGFPAAVTEVFRASNGEGFIITIIVTGYGGDISILCGVDNSGRIIRAAVLSHTETVGLGTPIFEEPHASQYWGIHIDGIEGISAVSGATITSNAYKNAMRYALAAFEIARGL